jgi:hypothetical protein
MNLPDEERIRLQQPLHASLDAGTRDSSTGPDSLDRPGPEALTGAAE